MPNKKITVVGDGAEQPLTPEEEHRLEVRVDQMLDPTLPDSSTGAANAAPATEVTSDTPELAASAKSVTKIVTKFADDEAAASQDDTIESAPAPLPVPEPEAQPPAPELAKPTVRKIAIRHHDDDAADDETAADQPADKPAPKKAAKSAATKPKKAKKPATKKSKAHDDNLESEADAIAAAALAAAEQLQTKHRAEASAPENASEISEPADAEPAESAPDLPTAEEPTDTTKGAPPLIQKHSAAPIGAAAETDEPEAIAAPSVGKPINIVDNSGNTPETAQTEAAAPADEEAIASPEPGESETIETAEVDETEVESDNEAAPETEPEPTDEETTEDTTPGPPETEPEPAAEATTETEPEPEPAEAKKYRPPDGPIQFKRAEKPIEPYKPGTGPRPADSSDDLASEDAAIAQAFESREAPKPKFAVRRAAGRSMKAFLLTLLTLVVLVVIAAVALPSVRNHALALVGAKADLRVTVLDAADSTPLSGATVSAGSSRGTTGPDGTVTLHHVKLGSQQVSVQKYAFAASSQTVNVVWHDQNAVSTKLTTTGQHYKFSVVDYLSGQPVADAQVGNGKTFSVTDAKGNATLVATTTDTSVNILAGNYTEAQSTAAASGTTTIRLVPAGHDAYISRSAGKLNLYRNTVDGQHEQLVLASASNTATDLAIASKSDGSVIALVSTRDNTHDANGNLQDSLSLVTASNGAVSAVDHADTIKLIGWFNSRIVYVLSKTTTSTTDANRYQLVSYNTAGKKRTVLDHAAYLNDIISAKGTIYYATAANSSSDGQFLSIQPDGSAKKVLLSGEVAAITRTGYSQLTLSGVNKWYNYSLGSAKPTPIATAVSADSRQYVDSPTGTMSVYIDTKASTPKLMLHDVKSGKDTQLVQVAGLAYPVHWLSSKAIVYRVSHGGMVTDNVISPDGGSPKTIANVSDIAGIALWHE